MNPRKKRLIDASRVAALFATLGSEIDQAWRRTRYDFDQFVDIAHDALASAAIGEQLSYRDLVNWVARATELPPQNLASGFGQPPLTLFAGEHFRIDALFWRFETTAIHQHAFGGAFTVLAGSSIHSRHTFRRERQVSPGFMLGQLSLAEIEWLRPGAVRRIPRGERMIHSQFHLEMPSVTIVAQSVTDSKLGSEYTYYPPTVALDPSYRDDLRGRQLQFVELAAAIEPSYLERVAIDIVRGGDLHTTFLVLSQLWPHSIALRERLLAAARARHGDLVSSLVPAVEEEQRRKRLFALRRVATDPEHRLLLALLLTLEDRPSIDSFLREVMPGAEPAALLEQWIVALSRTAQLGLSFDQTLTRLLKACLQGTTGQELLGQLRREYRPADINAGAADIEEACRLIRENNVLAPLFRRQRRPYID